MDKKKELKLPEKYRGFYENTSLLVAQFKKLSTCFSFQGTLNALLDCLNTKEYKGARDKHIAIIKKVVEILINDRNLTVLREQESQEKIIPDVEQAKAIVLGALLFRCHKIAYPPPFTKDYATKTLSGVAASIGNFTGFFSTEKIEEPCRLEKMVFPILKIEKIDSIDPYFMKICLESYLDFMNKNMARFGDIKDLVVKDHIDEVIDKIKCFRPLAKEIEYIMQRLVVLRSISKDLLEILEGITKILDSQCVEKLLEIAGTSTRMGIDKLVPEGSPFQARFLFLVNYVFSGILNTPEKAKDMSAGVLQNTMLTVLEYFCVYSLFGAYSVVFYDIGEGIPTDYLNDSMQKKAENMEFLLIKALQLPHEPLDREEAFKALSNVFIPFYMKHKKINHDDAMSAFEDSCILAEKYFAPKINTRSEQTENTFTL